MDYLEECKVRFAEAQKRVQATHQELQAVSARHQAAVQEQNSLQYLIGLEIARRQSGTETTSSTTNGSPQVSPPEAATPQTSEINKTDMIRELLRRHPAGMTPTEIWKEVKNQMNHRAYLYSILGRLKDRDELILRRKKYMLKMTPKTAEDGERTQHVVQ